MRRLARAGLVLAALGLAGVEGVRADEADARLVRTALQAACPALESPAALGRAVEAAGPVARAPLAVRGREVGTRLTVPLAGGGELRVERLAPGGRLRRLTLDLRRPGPDGPRPTLVALAGPDCAVRRARRIAYTADRARDQLVLLAPDLTTERARQPLNPPVPAGAEPEGPRAAIVDSGVAYTLDAVARRLARNADGGLVGYDFWEQDRRPFDGNPARSPYFPQRHGTETASVLLREAPAAALVPYRYPRPDMSRMAELVRHAAAAGVRVVALPLGSRSESDWTAFARAARGHPDMLFVVAAGNTGRSLEDLPIYPPVLDLDNMLVVTSSTADGRLARGSTWSTEHVDLMLPAEQVAVTTWQGTRRTAAGTSYAAPRLAALAVRLQAAHPAWDAAQLKAAILERTQPPPAGQTRVTRHGWIPDPAGPLAPQ